MGEVISFIGPTSVGEKDKLSSYTEQFFRSGKDTDVMSTLQLMSA